MLILIKIQIAHGIENQWYGPMVFMWNVVYLKEEIKLA